MANVSGPRGYVVGVDETPDEKEPFPATIVTLGGTVHGAKGRGYLYYVPFGRETAAPTQAWNAGRVQERAGTPVVVGYDKDQLVILGLDKSRMEPNGYRGYRSPLFGQHAPDHRWSSGDPLYVDTRQIQDLMVRPAGLFKVNISPGRYGNGLGYVYFAGYQNYDLSAHQPAVAGTKRRVGLYLDSANTVQEVVGGLFAVTAVLPEVAWPDGVFRLASVILFESKDFIDFEYVKQEKALWVNPVSKATALYTPAGTLAWSVDAAGNLDNTLGGVMTAPATEVIVKVRNASGATVAAGDLGYVDELGQYKRTTTASDLKNWAVVVVGGANNADIYVGIRGRFPVAYTGTTPVSGDYLTTSATGGAAQAQAFVSPAILGVIPPGVTAAGGLIEALLLCNTVRKIATNTNDLLRINTLSTTDFVATINGAPSGSTLTYNAPSSGAEDTIVPVSSSQVGKIVLWNTTRGTSALISSVNTGTNVITLTAAVPGAWASGDTITTRSQTATGAIDTNTYLYELDLSGAGLDPLTRHIELNIAHKDSTPSGSNYLLVHPFEAVTGAFSVGDFTSGEGTATPFAVKLSVIALKQNKLCFACHANGSGTSHLIIRVRALDVAAP